MEGGERTAKRAHLSIGSPLLHSREEEEDEEDEEKGEFACSTKKRLETGRGGARGGKARERGAYAWTVREWFGTRYRIKYT